MWRFNKLCLFTMRLPVQSPKHDERNLSGIVELADCSLTAPEVPDKATHFAVTMVYASPSQPRPTSKDSVMIPECCAPHTKAISYETTSLVT